MDQTTSNYIKHIDWDLMTRATTRELRADALMALSILLLGAFLFASGRGLLDRWELSAARGQSLSVDDLLGAFAAAAGLAIVAWWTFAVMLAVTVAALARCGRPRAAARAGKYCPAFMRRLAVAALSVQLLAAPMAQAAVPPTGPAWVPTQEAAVQAQWSPTAAQLAANPPEADVPAAPVTQLQATPESPLATQSRMAERRAPQTPLAEAPAPQPQATQTPTPQPLPTDPPATETPSTDAPPAAVRPDWRPSAPVPDPGLLAPRPVRAAQDTASTGNAVTVLAGDTLWDIAKRHLGPAASDVDVALHWPRWYEANKARIGESPHVLLPGQILNAPSTR